MSDHIITDVSNLRASSPKLDLGNIDVLLQNLIWAYQVIVSSEPLMQLAIDESPSSAKVFRGYLQKHMSEEHDHAKWLAEDLQTAGIDVTKLPLNRSAVELAGTQYYLIKHVSPVCVLGYMAISEGFPFPLQALETLEGIHGSKLLRCLRYHAENDIEHRKELFETIDRINDPLIYENAIRTQYLMDEAFRGTGS